MTIFCSCLLFYTKKRFGVCVCACGFEFAFTVNCSTPLYEVFWRRVGSSFFCSWRAYKKVGRFLYLHLVSAVTVSLH